jgi:thiol-disulfide isomerase/thioredoxin
MYGVIVGIAVAIILVLCLLVFVLPPALYLDPSYVEKGIDLNVNSYFFRPGEKVAIDILRVDDNQLIKKNEYIANSIGILTFKFSSSDLDKGDYKLILHSGRGEISRSFTVRVPDIISVPLPPGLPVPSKLLQIEPVRGLPGTVFKITAKSLRPLTMVTVKVVACVNSVCTENRTVYIRKGEQESTDANGSLVTLITADNKWAEYNYVSIDDGRTMLAGYIPIKPPLICSCEGTTECGQEGCCAPKFTLASLSGNSITLCNEYNKGLSPQPVIWINFWNTSCPGCAEYMKIIQRIKDNWNKGEMKVFSINVGEDPSIVSNFLIDRGYSFYGDSDYPVLFDVDKSVKGRYQPGGDPPHYFIDQKGIIRKVKFGYGSIKSDGEVRAIVDEIIRRSK